MHTPTKARHYLLEREALVSFPDTLSRAAHLVVQGICSPTVAGKAAGLSRDAVRRAAYKMAKDKDKIGKPGRPSSLGPRAEKKFKDWLGGEIALNRDPDVGVALKKATTIRTEESGHFMDACSVRPAWLRLFKQRNPDFSVAPARSLEEVRFFLFKLIF